MQNRIIEPENNPLNAVIILGSARSDGNTRIVVEQFARMANVTLVDLNDWAIEPFSYEPGEREDDFMPLMTELIKYDTWIMATPVYWYSMSSVMKVFFDRFTDLLKWRKETGRLLRGKSMALISCSGHNDVDSFFGKPFERTAQYLGMDFIGWLHSWVKEGLMPQEAIEEAFRFKTLLEDRAVSRVTT